MFHDSRSPSTLENPASKRPRILNNSDDHIFINEVRGKVVNEPKGDDDYEKRIAVLYAKYDTPKKGEPIKSNTKANQLTSEDKLNLDQVLNENDKNTTARQRFDDDLWELQQSSHLLTTKMGVGKFKSNRSHTSAVVSAEHIAPIPSPIILPSMPKPMNATFNGPIKTNHSVTPNSTTPKPTSTAISSTMTR